MVNPKVAGYLSGHFQQIRGYSNPYIWNALQPLHEWQEAEGVTGPIGEIGVMLGKFFAALALAKDAYGPHFAFDVFDLTQFNLGGGPRGNLEIFKENLKAAGVEAAKVEIRQVDSMAITARDIEEVRDATGGGFSLFSVDGCHRAEHTVNDLQIAMELTKPGGLILLDDYYNQDWPGVQEGTVRLYLNSLPRFIPIAFTCNKLLLAHIGYAEAMFAHLKSELPGRIPGLRITEAPRFGYPTLNIYPDMKSDRYLS